MLTSPLLYYFSANVLSVFSAFWNFFPLPYGEYIPRKAKRKLLFEKIKEEFF